MKARFFTVLFWAHSGLFAQAGPSDFYHEGANRYIQGQLQQAYSLVQRGLAKYPNNPNLVALAAHLQDELEQQKENQQDNQKKPQDSQDQQQAQNGEENASAKEPSPSQESKSEKDSNSKENSNAEQSKPDAGTQEQAQAKDSPEAYLPDSLKQDKGNDERLRDSSDTLNPKDSSKQQAQQESLGDSLQASDTTSWKHSGPTDFDKMTSDEAKRLLNNFKEEKRGRRIWQGSTGDQIW